MGDRRQRRDVVRELVSRPDPSGYYVVVLKREALRELGELLSSKGVVVEEAGPIVVARTRSRRLAAEIARQALRRGLLAEG